MPAFADVIRAMATEHPELDAAELAAKLRDNGYPHAKTGAVGAALRRKSAHDRTRRSSLTQPLGPAVDWPPEMLAALDECVLADATVKQTLKRLGTSSGATTRGALLRLRQVLLAERQRQWPEAAE
jgi:hypothetical protein